MPTLAEVIQNQNSLGLGFANPNSKEQLERDFYYEFGKFICTFASTEFFVHRIFRRVSGLDDARSRAIVGGDAIAKMMSTTKRLASLNKAKFSAKKRKELEILFNQLSAISNFRHSLVHSGVDVEEGVIRSINFTTAKTRETIQELSFGIEDVRNANHDLAVIVMRLSQLLESRHLARAERKYLHAPWRYKPVSRDNLWKRMLVAALRQSPPPQSSPASP